jgi:hypothetical protein
MIRLVVFHLHGVSGKSAKMLPAYYVESDCEPIGARIYAGTAPSDDASFDIYNNGVSIFKDRGQESVDKTTGVISTIGSGTSIILSAGENSDEYAEDFNEDVIEGGSWLTCICNKASGGRDITVQIELRQLSEDEEDIEDID